MDVYFQGTQSMNIEVSSMLYLILVTMNHRANAFIFFCGLKNM